jgi:choline dehydrogenase
VPTGRARCPRGNCADYDELERLGNKGSGWHDVLPIFKMFENNALGASPTRGVGGPLHITVPHDPDPLCAEIVEAARKIGLADVQDINESDAEQVGYSRQSVAGDRPCSPCTPGSSTSSSSMQQPREFTRP